MILAKFCTYRFLKIEVTSQDESLEYAQAHYYFAKNVM